MKSYLSDKVVIYIQSGPMGEKRFYNRITQGFSVRWDGKQFYDTSGASIRVYYRFANPFRSHPESERTWQSMAANDIKLTYNKTTFGGLKDASV